MNFFISDAMAQGGAGAPGAMMSPIIMLLAMVAIFYFLLMRPQQKRAKEHAALLSNLSKGDEVVTAGGVLGKVTGLGDNFISLDVGDGVTMRFQRHQIASLMPKGTIKSA